ncbi:MAG: hypothetical protein BroJett006_09520 [Betaproteobacteria bacterium]|nr:MAG: hypothetical protein BroJett006_09520 [Betaproteobacteria bacterium]
MSTTREKVAALMPLAERLHRGHHWRKDKAGNMACIKEPLDDFKLAQHCAGREAYGLCPIAPGESTCRVALLDLDSHGGETPFDEMQRIAAEVRDTARLFGLEGVAFRSSGGKGIHLIFMWQEEQDARSVRELLRQVLAACDLKPGAAGVAAGTAEIFPKQDRVEVGSYGSMFVLPLAGESVLLDDEGNPLPRDAILQLEWPMSDPVPLVARPLKPERPAVDLSAPDIARLRSALAAIPNDGAGLPYDQWLRVVFGAHYATGGSAEGLALIHEFSARSSKYDPDFLDEKVLRYVNDGREGDVVTDRTLYAMAASHGWQDPAIADDFEALPVEAEKPLPLPAFVRNRSGDILSTDDNVAKALRRPDVCGYRIGFDTFRDELMLAPEGTGEWRPFSDADYTRISIPLERGGFKTTSADRLRSCVRLVADEHRFDSAMTWLDSLGWDGKPRIANFLTNYAGVEESDYTRAVSLYLFTAMAGRVLAPGCKADMVPVLVGPQGTGKSSLVAALVLAPEHFVEVSFHEDENTLARKMRGRLLGEIAELRGLRTKELEAIKAFITRTHENWVPKWQEFAKTFPRRLVFVGTTNTDEFLADETGNRRWLPVRVGRIDVEAIRRDRLQLWAEARERYKVEGILFHGAEQLAGEAHQAHLITDAWEAHVAAWLATPTAELIGMGDENTLNGDRPFRIGDVLGGALSLQARDQDTARQLRAGRVLRKLGYGDKQMTVDGVRAKFWRRGDAA